jgi:hypothetical protein
LFTGSKGQNESTFARAEISLLKNDDWLLRLNTSSFRWVIFCGALPIAATLYARLSLLGGLPATDEGIYAFSAQWIHHGLKTWGRLPDDGTLQLYPLLLSWVFGSDWNPLLLLRICDLAVALAAAWLLYLIAVDESESAVAGAVIATFFSFAMNQHAFIQSGFKNSIFAAYVPLLAAVRLALHAGPGSSSRWFAVGGLLAAAVLLRETFVHFAAFGFVAILAARGWPSALRYAAGGTAAGLLILGLLATWRGGIASAVEAYTELGHGYAFLATERVRYFRDAVGVFMQAAAPALLLSVVASAFWLYSREIPGRIGRGVFWLAAAAVPLTEPMMKLGFPYHLSVSLVGLCGMAALGWRTIADFPRRAVAAAMIAVLGMAVVLAGPQVSRMEEARGIGRANLGALTVRDWTPGAVERSNYLLLAKAIRNQMPGAGTLSISGAAFVLYPLTGLLPPAYSMRDASQLAFALDFRVPELREALRTCPPNIVMVTSRPQHWGREALMEAIAGMPEYSLSAEVPLSGEKDYGHFGGTIHVRKGSGACRASKHP